MIDEFAKDHLHGRLRRDRRALLWKLDGRTGLRAEHEKQIDEEARAAHRAKIEQAARSAAPVKA
ncbi:hypothetical protein [Streptomyces sp. NPDC048611]|uniref:hypothetical protein n=1 Tax=Streptomyces sp. NPDC048611 TaxID=3155635 RepID=UPI00342AC5FE